MTTATATKTENSTRNTRSFQRHLTHTDKERERHAGCDYIKRMNYTVSSLLTIKAALSSFTVVHATHHQQHKHPIKGDQMKNGHPL